jgi:DNA-binding NtrC family response regulator
MARILVIEDESILRKNICDRLRADGHDVFDAEGGEEGIELVGQLAPDLVLTDLRLPGIDGLDVLRGVKRTYPPTMVIMVTAHGTQETAVEAMREGAYDYLTKPVQLKELSLLIQRAVSHGRALDGVQYARDRERREGTLDQMIGASREMADLKHRVRQIAASPALKQPNPPTILISGETGVGKQLVAHAIHNEGPRAAGPFVHVNCTAVSEALFERELFGQVKGEYSGQEVETRKGLFAVADGGTILLDEIGLLSPSMQAKLLLTIEHRTIRPVGSTDAHRVDVHILATTNRDLTDAMRRDQFRSDLYHRLRVLEIPVAPLRERRDDIERLASTFIDQHAARFGVSPPRLTDAARQCLNSHSWPGNVRELSHTIESALLLIDSDAIDARHLRLTSPLADAGLEIALPGGDRVVVDFKRGRPTMEEIEHRILAAAFAYTGENLSRTARILGLTREAVRYRLKKHGESLPSGA